MALTKVLIVEDSLPDFVLAQEYLSNMPPYDQPDRAENIDALKKMVGKPYEAILLDLCLPESRGIDTLLSVQAILSDTINEDTPIIVMTGVSDFGISKEALKLGAKDYLVKGDFGPHELQRALTFSTYSHNNPKRMRGLRKIW